jgi:hypothetical protein
MSEKPIIFSPPMVRAIGEGGKTMTRMVIKEPVCADKNGSIKIKGHWVNPERDTGTALSDIAPYNIGDVLWVRKRFAETLDGEYLYLVDPIFDGCGKGDFGWDWKPSIHMPRKAARLFLEVNGVWVERLREITEEDAIAEGMNVKWLEKWIQDNYVELEEDACWIVGDNADQGLSYCRECGEEAIRRLEKKHPGKNYILDGGYDWQKDDMPTQCHLCDKDLTLTATGGLR